jgi:hypothetical protein
VRFLAHAGPGGGRSLRHYIYRERMGIVMKSKNGLGRCLTIMSVLLGLLFVVPIATAWGDEFVVARSGKAVEEAATNGGSGYVGQQELDFGGYQVKCASARSTGSASQYNLTVSSLLSHCTTDAHFGENEVPIKTLVSGPLVIGYSLIGRPVTVTEPFSVEIKPIRCTIKVAPRGEPSYGLIYRNEEASTGKLKRFPSGFQKKLQILVQITGLEYTLEGPCRGEHATASDGVYEGTTRDEVVGGDLSVHHETSESTGWEVVEN